MTTYEKFLETRRGAKMSLSLYRRLSNAFMEDIDKNKIAILPDIERRVMNERDHKAFSKFTWRTIINGLPAFQKDFVQPVTEQWVVCQNKLNSKNDIDNLEAELDTKTYHALGGNKAYAYVHISLLCEEDREYFKKIISNRVEGTTSNARNKLYALSKKD